VGLDRFRVGRIDAERAPPIVPVQRQRDRGLPPLSFELNAVPHATR
jgi:hypothetical protein